MRPVVLLIGLVGVVCGYGQRPCIAGFPERDVNGLAIDTVEYLQVVDSCAGAVLFHWSPLAGLLLIDRISPNEAELTGVVAVPQPGKDDLYVRIDALQWGVRVDSSSFVLSKPVVLEKAVVDGAYVKEARAMFAKMKRIKKYTDEDVSRLSLAEWDQLRDLSFMIMFCSINGDKQCQEFMLSMRTLFPGLGLGALSESHRGNEIISRYFTDCPQR